MIPIITIYTPIIPRIKFHTKARPNASVTNASPLTTNLVTPRLHDKDQAVGTLDAI